MPTSADRRPALAQAMVAGRSFLFVPADRPDRFEKAAASGCDEVILDLEDGVPAERAVQSRANVAAWLSASGRAVVRISAPTDPRHGRDLDVLTALPGLRAVVVAKAEDPDSIAEVYARLSGDVPLIALIETAVGLNSIHDIAVAQGVIRLAFGSIDYALDIGASEDEMALLHARSVIVHASRLAQLASPLDGVTGHVGDVAMVAAHAARARRLGFGGKLCIHPSHVVAVNATFQPTQRELDHARRVLNRAAVTPGTFQIDGEMVDKPVLDRARRTLARAGLIPTAPYQGGTDASA